MAVRTRVEPINRDIDLIVSEDLSPSARSKLLASFAEEQFKEAQTLNSRALGRVPKYETFVDGRAGADLATVKPSGSIVFEFELVSDVIEWIQQMLIQHSPERSGRYSRSHILFADGVEVQFGANVPDAHEYVFVNTQPYARKIERGLSAQAKSGVYEIVSVLASRRFGNIAKVKFTFRAILNGGLHTISRVGPLQVKRSKNGRFLKGSHVRAGNATERQQRQPAIIVTV